MEVIKVSPRGYCYGVVDAMQIARNAAKDPMIPRPIYIVGLIVHNRFAVDELTTLGITTLDGPDRASILEQINAGTVIFTAHGVSPAVKRRAQERGLHCIDATCPDVTKTHDLVKQLVAEGYHILYIGKKGHPEPEGVIGEAPGFVHLIENEADLAALDLSEAQTRKLALSTQTTLSQWDTQRLIEAVRARWPQVVVHTTFVWQPRHARRPLSPRPGEPTSLLSSATRAVTTPTGWCKFPKRSPACRRSVSSDWKTCGPNGWPARSALL
jgi:4-hydroxy-3-methylbut-2-enyl diphosphate reductase